MTMLQGFPPIIDKDSRVLILGSFPSPKSLEVNEYYGNKGNDFWRVLGKVIGADLHDSAFENKKSRLLEHRIALWDVFAEAERDGAADSNFKSVIYNDFKSLFKQYSNIKLILITGNKAYESYDELRIKDKPYFKIPSTSGVNRRINVDGKAKIISDLFRKNNIYE